MHIIYVFVVLLHYSFLFRDVDWVFSIFVLSCRPKKEMSIINERVLVLTAVWNDYDEHHFFSASSTPWKSTEKLGSSEKHQRFQHIYNFQATQGNIDLRDPNLRDKFDFRECCRCADSL